MLSISKVAKQLGVTNNTIRKWVREGRLTCRRSVGNHRYFSEEDLKEFYAWRDELDGMREIKAYATNRIHELLNYK